MKTLTKTQVVNFIKKNGHEYFDGAVVATIAGIKVGVCKSVMVLLDEGYKFPPFKSVDVGGKYGELDFYKPNGSSVSYFGEYRDSISDKYYEVLNAITA